MNGRSVEEILIQSATITIGNEIRATISSEWIAIWREFSQDGETAAAKRRWSAPRAAWIAAVVLQGQKMGMLDLD
jgi:hypothetical protein